MGWGTGSAEQLLAAHTGRRGWGGNCFKSVWHIRSNVGHSSSGACLIGSPFKHASNENTVGEQLVTELGIGVGASCCSIVALFEGNHTIPSLS